MSLIIINVLVGVVFTNLNSDGSLPPHVIYKIRQNASFTDSTKSVRDKFWHPGPGSWAYNYYQFGFVWVQVGPCLSLDVGVLGT